jgi:diaminopimelate epimerase
MFFADIEAKSKMVALTGANGIMEIQEPPKGENYEYTVVFHSSLGDCGPVPICGNGSRCTVAYACTHGIVPPERYANYKFKAADGCHNASFKADKVNGEHIVKISMMDIKSVVKISSEEWYANSGTAHFVKFVPVGTVQSIDLIAEGQRLSEQYSYLAPGLFVLVNFVEDRGDNIFGRCYDTSGGNEILACGTASTVIAVVHASSKKEIDGHNEKIISWEMGKIAVGYRKQDESYTDLSLMSEVNIQIAGKYFCT